jgi:hypothetical protein
MYQGMTGRYKVRTLLDDSPTRGFTGGVNDEGEVLGSHKGGDGLANKVESVFQPFSGRGKARKISGLSKIISNVDE